MQCVLSSISSTLVGVYAAYVGLLLLNFIGSLTYFIASTQHGIGCSSGPTFGLSILYLVLFTPCSFVCWFRPVYTAFQLVSFTAHTTLVVFNFDQNLVVCVVNIFNTVTGNLFRRDASNLTVLSSLITRCNKIRNKQSCYIKLSSTKVNNCRVYCFILHLVIYAVCCIRNK